MKKIGIEKSFTLKTHVFFGIFIEEYNTLSVFPLKTSYKLIRQLITMNCHSWLDRKEIRQEHLQDHPVSLKNIYKTTLHDCKVLLNRISKSYQ